MFGVGCPFLVSDVGLEVDRRGCGCILDEHL
jgi:hypothetical protein